jgi:hypothetical protein
MKQSEKFALAEWLAYFDDDLSYDQIMGILETDEWSHPDINVWEVVENHTLQQVSEFVSNTKSHFEMYTNDLVSALESAIRLAQENAPDMIDDQDFTDRLNGLLGVLADWRGV